jgi:cytochrome c-type biogenesis protein CcmE
MLSKLKVPLALAAALAGVGVLVASGVSRNDIYMSTLDEWRPERAERETVRLVGFVAEGSIAEERERLVTRFTLRSESGERTLPVRFEGVTPDLFRDGTQLVATGRIESDGTFHATDLMTKCPSKYEGVERVPESPSEPASAAGDPPASGQAT